MKMSVVEQTPTRTHGDKADDVKKDASAVAEDELKKQMISNARES